MIGDTTTIYSSHVVAPYTSILTYVMPLFDNHIQLIAQMQLCKLLNISIIGKGHYMSSIFKIV